MQTVCPRLRPLKSRAGVCSFLSCLSWVLPNYKGGLPALAPSYALIQRLPAVRIDEKNISKKGRSTVEKGPQEESWVAIPEELGGYVAGLKNAVEKGTEEQLAPFAITPTEYAILTICQARGTTTVSELAQYIPVDAGRISRIVNNLYQRRLLARQRLQEDRRVVKLWLTEDGQRLAPELMERVVAYNEMLAEGVTRAERDAFVSTYNKIMRNYAGYRQRQAEEEAE